MKIQVAAAKVGKYATSESGDTLEMIERPQGGVSFVLADGQRSGKSAKLISNLVVRKTISLLGEGVRDGAAARAAHDYLRMHRRGQVSATLNIISVDLTTQSFVISRNSHCPVIVFTARGMRVLNDECNPVGIYNGTKPVITELPIEAGTYVIIFTDGVIHAGRHTGQQMDVIECARSLLAEGYTEAQAIADAILDRAIELDQGRPSDDISVLVVAAISPEHSDNVRRVSVSFPVRLITF